MKCAVCAGGGGGESGEASVVSPVIVHEAQDRPYWTIGRTLKALPLPKVGFARRGMGVCKTSQCASSRTRGLEC